MIFPASRTGVGGVHRPTYLIFQITLLELSWWTVCILATKIMNILEYPRSVILMYTFPTLFIGALEIWIKAAFSRRQLDNVSPPICGSYSNCKNTCKINVCLAADLISARAPHFGQCGWVAGWLEGGVCWGPVLQPIIYLCGR